MRTGSLSILKNQNSSEKVFLNSVKNLTLAAAIFLSSYCFGEVNAELKIVNQERSSNYNRVVFYAGRDQLQIKKVGQAVQIKTLNEDLYQLIAAEIKSLDLDKTYVSNVNNYKDEGNSNSFIISFELTKPNIEMFSFYREREKKYVLDLWIDGDETTLSKKIVETKNVEKNNEQNDYNVDQVSTKLAQTNRSINTETALSKVKKANSVELVNTENKSTKKEEVTVSKVEEKVNEDKILSSLVVDPNRKFGLSDKVRETELSEQQKKYKDFRYGATFFWEYDPIVPSLKDAVNLEAKTPDIFYPIVNRKFEKNEKEAHLQLTINLFRKKNYGLMNKSITLFQQKYGDKSEWELLEFLKINALMRENIEKPNPEIFKNAIGRLNGIVEKSENYEMKKAVWKFLLTYYLQKNEFLKTLQISKDFYAETRSNFDFEESPYPAEVMLYSLARQGLVQQLSELANEKNIRKVVAPAIILSYQSFAKLRANQVDEVISLYEKSRAGMIGEISPSLLYNTSEAYFRKGDYLKAFTLYQKFAKDFPYELTASNALVRIGLCSDLLERDYEETLAFYKDALDRAVSSEVSYEARIRYVAFRSVRKNDLDDRDREMRIFLEQDKNSNLVMNKNLQKLLYQVRLRTLIVDGKYKEALAYFTLLPLPSMAKIDVRSFVGDAAEIIYGLIEEHYKKAEYTAVIKTWQNYKNVYVDKVAMDPYLNFLVGSSYVKLGLFKGFDEVYAGFKNLKSNPTRTFPIWVNRPKTVPAETLLTELSVIKDLKLKNFDLALKEIEDLTKLDSTNNRVMAYRGLISYAKKDYKSAISNLENYLSSDQVKSIYDPQDIADIVKAYTDSIYESGDTEKFTKVANAILNDTNSIGTKNAYMQSVRERIAYLAIEINAGKTNVEGFESVEKSVEAFKKNYSKSIYLGRVNYLLGLHFVRTNRTKEGREIFNTLSTDTNVSDYIKELAKSELSILSLKDKTL